MKRIISAIICAAMCLCCMGAFAEEAGFIQTAAAVVELHDIFLSEGYEYGQGYPLIQVGEDEYPGCVAYSTDSRLVDIIFEPGDEGGELQLINIVIFRDDLEADINSFNEIAMHLVGVVFAYMPEMVASGGQDAFTDALVDKMLEAYYMPHGETWYAEPVDFAGVAEVVAYVMNDTFGVYVWFYEPVTYEFMAERLEMLK